MDETKVESYVPYRISRIGFISKYGLKVTQHVSGATWKYICPICHQEKQTFFHCIKDNKSCGCDKEGQRQKTLQGRYEALVGQKFGKLTCLKFVGLAEHRESLFLWRCECGTEKVLPGCEVKRKRYKNFGCGCGRLEHIAEVNEKSQNRMKNKWDKVIGKKFGMLTVRGLDHTRKYRLRGKGSPRTMPYFECLCDCGAIIVIAGRPLLQKKTVSCGCRKSVQEGKIGEVLMELGVKYQRQKAFPGLRGDQLPLHFDYYLPESNKIIELHGKQHFFWIKYFHPDIENFELLKEYDRRKREYCQAHGIELIEYTYKQKFPEIRADLIRRFAPAAS